MTLPNEDTYISNLLGAIRRRWYIVLACLIVAPGVALAVSLGKTKQYDAKAEILFRESHYDQILFGSSAIPAPDPTRQAATNLKLVDLGTVSQRVAQKLGVSAEAVRDAISVSPEGEADIASVTATWSNAAFSARLANVYSQQFIASRREAEKAQLLEARRTVQAQIAGMSAAERRSITDQTLQQRASQLRTLAALQTGDAELASTAALPTGPSAPTPKRDAILGLVLGLLLGVGLALIVDRSDRRLRRAEDMRLALRVPVLGSVPLKRSLNAGGSLDARNADVFRAVHANLRGFELEHAPRALMFTSPGSGDGRTGVAWHFAAAAAESGARVLLVHADLRSPSRVPGLTTVLSGEAALQEVVRSTPLGSGTLDVLAAGPEAGPPMRLLGTPRMGELLAQASRDYDLVVVDVPPLGFVPDGIPLAKSVEGAVLVVRLGGHTEQALTALRAQLDHLGLRVVGAILTGARPSAERYGSAELAPPPPRATAI